MADHLRRVIEQNDFSGAGDITASFGVTLMAESDSIEAFVKRVDSALYKSKMDGRNRITVIPAN